MVQGERLTFGFDGTWQGTAVLYDHQTGSRWMHLTGACFQGPLKGRVMERVTGRHATWGRWFLEHPDTDVLAREPRWEGEPGVKGYFTREGARSGSPHIPAYFRPTIQDHDDRLQPSVLVYGITVGGVARAYPLADLRHVQRVEEDVGGVPVTVWYDAASRSVAAFDRRLGYETLSFGMPQRGAGRTTVASVDGSLWTMEGECIAGPRRTSRLMPLRGLLCEWYGWYAHHPDTTLWAP